MFRRVISMFLGVEILKKVMNQQLETLIVNLAVKSEMKYVEK